MNGKSNRRWEIRSGVDGFTFELFAGCMADIADSVEQINALCREGQLETHSLNRAARNVSVAVRKLMFDGNGYLFKECVEPLLHPLKDPKRRPRKGLRADVLVERIGGMSIDYTLGESASPGARVTATSKSLIAPARSPSSPLHAPRL